MLDGTKGLFELTKEKKMLLKIIIFYLNPLIKNNCVKYMPKIIS